MAEFEIKQSSNKQYYFHLQSTGNNKVILSSEQYTTKDGCKNGIESVKENALNDSRYNKVIARNGLYYFTLEAANGKVIGTSEQYATSASRDHGIQLVKDQAPTAPVVDLT
jgi:uncharacterized protein